MNKTITKRDALARVWLVLVAPCQIAILWALAVQGAVVLHADRSLEFMPKLYWDDPDVTEQGVAVAAIGWCLCMYVAKKHKELATVLANQAVQENLKKQRKILRRTDPFEREWVASQFPPEATDFDHWFAIYDRMFFWRRFMTFYVAPAFVLLGGIIYRNANSSHLEVIADELRPAPEYLRSGPDYWKAASGVKRLDRSDTNIAISVARIAADGGMVLLRVFDYLLIHVPSWVYVIAAVSAWLMEPNDDDVDDADDDDNEGDETWRRSSPSAR
ncbi:MAG: hypothetical protein U0746_02990 [Gemmataceae bacterium]